jgi:hypothetical protein
VTLAIFLEAFTLLAVTTASLRLEFNFLQDILLVYGFFFGIVTILA